MTVIEARAVPLEITYILAGHAFSSYYRMVCVCVAAAFSVLHERPVSCVISLSPSPSDRIRPAPSKQLLSCCAYVCCSFDHASKASIQCSRSATATRRPKQHTALQGLDRRRRVVAVWPGRNVRLNQKQTTGTTLV